MKLKSFHVLLQALKCGYDEFLFFCMHHNLEVGWMLEPLSAHKNKLFTCLCCEVWNIKNKNVLNYGWCALGELTLMLIPW
jgi:hypothetical protein